MKCLVAAAVLVLLLSGAARAQEVPPALFVQIDGNSRPLEIAEVRAEVRILGPLAETAMTITFANPHDRDLEGELYFPLPAGATVNGYALDVRGRMVDGVAVTREKARRTFETEVRKGIDPGIVEWTRGNVFRTRIFPLPAGGSRTVTVRWVSELDATGDGERYVLPLAFRQKVDTLSLRIEVPRSGTAPEIADDGFANFAFAEWRGGYLAEKTMKDVVADHDLAVLLPPVEGAPVLVERDDRGVVRFLLANVLIPPDAEPRPAPERIRVYWDASGSRADADRGRELEFLRRVLGAALAEREAVTVDLVVFRDRAEPLRTFRIDGGSLEGLLEVVASTPCDGGTGAPELRTGKGASAPDLVLLFGDGIETFGDRWGEPPSVPLYAIHSGPAVDRARLGALSRATGGEVLDLGRLAMDEAVAAVGIPVHSFHSAIADSPSVSGTWPRGPAPARSRFLFTGVLRGDEAAVTLRFGYGAATQSKAFRVSAADAVPGNLLRRYWAQRKLEHLLGDQDANEREITALGREFGLVTPFTSLIVLETLEQYLEHGILPPATMPEMRTDYIEIVEGRRRETEELRRSKLETVVELWRARVEWWETDFEVPEGFRYRAPEEATNDGLGGDDGAPEAESGGLAAPAPGGPAGGEAGGGSGGFFFGSPGEEGEDLEDPATAPAIALKEWDPETPYLDALKEAPAERRYDVYLSWREKFATSPAFFLDCADFFVREGEEELGIRVLSNLAEMKLEDAALLRVLGHRLEQLGRLDLAIGVFEGARRLRPEEPQSHRDLGLALAARGSREDLERAIELLDHVVRHEWDRFAGIEIPVLMELNRLIPKARAAGITEIPVDPRLVKPLPVDVRIVMTWDADLTDMDLHVVEPSGEEAFYGHDRTTIGGLVSRDFTDGYGPEEYVLKKAMPGNYRIKANYYGSSAAKLIGAVTLHVDVYTNYGRKNERVRSLTLRLTEPKETFLVGVIEF